MPKSDEQPNEFSSQNDLEEYKEIQASIVAAQLIFPNEVDEDNVECLESTTMDIEKTSSTIPQV
ncbi:hypothetical protein PanWU01x14_023450 [Parasponia andersonii]|uniref:Uncharacterized protein n=1 Tax=Parasponia andersonii TaxID=3476 RepID=A0A2P5DXH7_PARAD|nr:hypothetical protein PanWU01x14_023450 [Parasponia andersonii]